MHHYSSVTRVHQGTDRGGTSRWGPGNELIEINMQIPDLGGFERGSDDGMMQLAIGGRSGNAKPKRGQ